MIVPVIGSGGLIAVVISMISIYSASKQTATHPYRVNGETHVANISPKADGLTTEGEATRNYFMELADSFRIFEDLQFAGPSTFDELLRNPQEFILQFKLAASKMNVCILRLDRIPTADVDIELVSFVNRWTDVGREFASCLSKTSDGLADLIEYGETDIDASRVLHRLERACAKIKKLEYDAKGLIERLAAKYGFSVSPTSESGHSVGVGQR